MTSLHTDIPSRAQITRLLTTRSPVAISLYLPTRSVSAGDAERIALTDLTVTAVGQLRDAGTDPEMVASVAEQLADLTEDDEFWRYLAGTLAVFVTPAALMTFRLPNQLSGMVEVSDRFHVTPLLRSLTFTKTAFVLELAQGSVRLLEVVPELRPMEVTVPAMPTDLASAVGAPRRSPGSEAQKLRQRQYARQVDRAMRPILAGQDLPLILAAVEPLAGIFRSVCSYPHLAATTIAPDPDDIALVTSARQVLDDLHVEQLRDAWGLFEQRTAQARTATDLADIARLATAGAIDTLFVDIDARISGLIDERTGAIEFRETGDATDYGVVDEISRRVWLTDGRIFAVRREEIPGGGETAAILRATPAALRGTNWLHRLVREHESGRVDRRRATLATTGHSD
ncbi:baeRF11 domain-containing protein [Actinophytocola sediminis]